MEPTILSNNQEFLVLIKPAGWITNDADTVKDQPTIQAFVRAKGLSALSLEYRNGIVHRLDKETSGVLLVAKSPQAFLELQRQFKAREVTKSYMALVHGILTPKTGTVNAPLGRLPWNRRRFGVLPGGRESTTDYSVIDNFERQKELFSLVELYPKTGRTHQIRIHLKYLHHPIVADSFYAGRKQSRKDRIWCSRLFLHASGINFFDPSTKLPLSFKAPLPSDLQGVLDSLTRTSLQ